MGAGLVTGLFDDYDELMVGTHIWPFVVFHDRPLEPGPNALRVATQIVATTELHGLDVYVTRVGGLFTSPPADLAHGDDDRSSARFQAQVNFEGAAASAFNLIICELTLLGLPSEPASPAVITLSHRWSDHIATMASSGRHHRRQLEPSSQLLQGRTDMLRAAPLMSIREVLAVRRAQHFAAINPWMPQLITGAYYMHELGQPAETVINAWVVAEQLINHWWDKDLSTITETLGSNRLKELHTDKAAGKTEALHSVGLIGDSLTGQLDETRKRRNDVMHDGDISHEAADRARKTVQASLGAELGEELIVPWRSGGVNW